MRKLLVAVVMLMIMGLNAGLAVAADASPPGANTTVKGKVLETKDVEPYTYLRLKTKDGEVWAAVGK